MTTQNHSTIAIDSPFGPVRLYASDAGLTHVYVSTLDGPEAINRETPLLARTASQLAEYFAGKRRVFDIPLAAQGTPFQQRVWNALATIPLGMTWSYGELARAIGKPAASRAVGAANGKNPIWLIVPCHRVIGANGTLTGYAGGLPIKQALLAHEQRMAGKPTAGVQLAL
jgi:methylated-DNA-[protein]-cysteine S-methyltransferase